MKVVLVFLLLLSFTACGKLENFTNIAEQKIETEPGELDQPDAPPILEIAQDAKGMFKVIGKSLFFNLYENGIIEFEYADHKKPGFGKTFQTDEVNVLKRAKLDPDELQKFTSLLKTEDLWNLKDEYKRKCCCTDANVDFKIGFSDGFKQKNINLNSYCDLGDITNPRTGQTGEFPQALSDLMKLVDAARLKYTPR